MHSIVVRALLMPCNRCHTSLIVDVVFVWLSKPFPNKLSLKLNPALHFGADKQAPLNVPCSILDGMRNKPADIFKWDVFYI